MVRRRVVVRIKSALVLASVSASFGAGLALAGAWSVRDVVAYAAEPPPTPPQDSVAEVVEAAARGCAAGGGVFWAGLEGGATVTRCRPWLELEPGPAVRRARR